MLTPHYQATDVSGPGHRTAEISIFDVNQHTTRAVALLRAEDSTANPPNRYSPIFLTSGLSHDGQLLFVKRPEITGRVSSFLTKRLSLLAVNLSTGEIVTVASILNRGGEVIGFDWYNEPDVSHTKKP